MPESWANIEPIARAVCARLYAVHSSAGASLDATIDRHWHVVAARIEAGLIDDDGNDILPVDTERELDAYRDWRARHPEYRVPPPVAPSFK